MERNWLKTNTNIESYDLFLGGGYLTLLLFLPILDCLSTRIDHILSSTRKGTKAHC